MAAVLSILFTFISTQIINFRGAAIIIHILSLFLGCFGVLIIASSNMDFNLKVASLGIYLNPVAIVLAVISLIFYFRGA
jgi:hypothetical protein